MRARQSQHVVLTPSPDALVGRKSLADPPADVTVENVDPLFTIVLLA